MVKVISLSDAAYVEMKALKREGESFSDVVLKLVEKPARKSITAFVGKWPGPKEELDKIKRLLGKDRKKFKLREVGNVLP